MIFAKNEVRITVFDDGSQNKELPTGFSADIEGKLFCYILQKNILVSIGII